MEKLLSFYQDITFSINMLKFMFIIFLSARSRNINISQRILKFEIFILSKLKGNPRGRGLGRLLLTFYF
jgi:hypothetical protein